MPKPQVSDDLWALIHPLLPPEPPKPKGGRPRISDRDALEGILFVLRTGTPWEHLPLELGYGSGMTCWRRLRDWHEAVSSRGCITCCSTAWPKLTNSTGAAPVSTARRSPRQGGLSNRSEPDGSRTSRKQTACDRRRTRNAAGGVDLTGQSTRQHAVRASAGRRSPDPQRSAGPPEEASRHAVRGQGV